MTAPPGTEVGLYVDLARKVEVGDVIETKSGRRYGVLKVRVQERGKHRGRQHLRVVVIDPNDGPVIKFKQVGDGIDVSPATVHRISWYPRKARKQ